MIDKQLSFENVLFEKERNLLYILSELRGLLNNLHYSRTMATATIPELQSIKHQKVLIEVKGNINNALEWLATMEYHVGDEMAKIAALERRPKKWYLDRIASDIYVDTAVTAPYTIYNNYIKIYRDATRLFNDYEGLLEELKPCQRLVKEFYVDMQLIGEKLEEIL